MRRILASALAASVIPFGVFATGTPVLTIQTVSRPSSTVPIPVGAQRVTMLTVQFSASCDGGVAIDTLTLHHRGLGNPQDLERIYAMSDGVRRTRTSPMTGRDGVATLRFRGFSIPACRTVSFDIFADVRTDAAATGQHTLQLLTEKDIVTQTPASVVLAPPGVPTVAIPVGKTIGSISVDVLTIPSLKYGSARTLARLKLKADAKDEQAITAIRFTNDGSARDGDLQNLFLETSGHSRLSQTVATLDGDHVRIVLDPPMILRRNEVRVVQLKGDVRASSRRTVGFIIQEPGDVEAHAVTGR